MRDVSEIYEELRKHAEQISKENGGAPVVVIIGGSEKAGIPRCVTVSVNLVDGREGRLRDLAGILQTAIQIESFEHLLKKYNRDNRGSRRTDGNIVPLGKPTGNAVTFWLIVQRLKFVARKALCHAASLNILTICYTGYLLR